MRISCCGFFILSILVFQSLGASLPERSVSPSRQFIIYGADVSLRGAVSQLAEQTKDNLLTLLRRRDDWKTPVVINLLLPQANLPEIPPAGLRFVQTDFGLRLQLDLTVGRDADPALVERELLRAILLEMVYREQPDIAAGTEYVQPPDWLLDGALALTPGRDRAPLVEALILSDKVTPLEEFLRPRTLSGLDSPARLLYRAYSLALVQLLVDGPDGPACLGRYIDNLSRASNNPLADLGAQFPALANDAEKTWRAGVSRLASAQSYQLLTFGETDRKLDELLRLEISDGENSGKISQLEDFLRKKVSPAQKAAFNQLSRELFVLGARAHPLLRPVVQEYQRIAGELSTGKRRGLRQSLARLKANRAELADRMRDIEDYLNWFEATQPKAQSGAFADYLKAADQSRELRQRRTDPLSVYLDALETQF